MTVTPPLSHSSSTNDDHYDGDGSGILSGLYGQYSTALSLCEATFSQCQSICNELCLELLA